MNLPLTSTYAVSYMWRSSLPRLLPLFHRRNTAMNDTVLRYAQHLASERRCSPRTVTTYRQELLLLVRWLSGRGVDRFEDVSRDLLLDYLARPGQDGRPVAPSTRNRKRTVLRGFFRWFIQSTGRTQNPMESIVRIRETRTEKPTLSAKDVGRLVGVLESRSGWPAARDACVVTLMFHVGLRLDELVSLDVDQVDLKAGLLLGVRRKGGNHQPLPLNGKALESLESWLHARESLEPATMALFLSRLRRRLARRTVQVMVHGLGQEAGFGFPVTPHMLRHAFATELLRSGANLEEVRRLLGHASITTTSRYSHPDQASLRRAVERLG